MNSQKTTWILGGAALVFGGALIAAFVAGPQIAAIAAIITLIDIAVVIALAFAGLAYAIAKAIRPGKAPAIATLLGSVVLFACCCLMIFTELFFGSLEWWFELWAEIGSLGQTAAGFGLCGLLLVFCVAAVVAIVWMVARATKQNKSAQADKKE